MRAERHPSEAERIAALHRYRILDTPREAEFDELVSLIGRICDVPIALITLLSEDRQWFKSAVGTDLTERPYDESLCSHAILQPNLLEVPDLAKDPRFADNAGVTGKMGLRFYAGVSLLTPEGLPLGTLCILDTRPRELTELQRESLRVMARQTMTALDLRRRAAEATEERARLAEGEERFRMVARATRDAVWDCDLRTGNIWWNEGIAELFGYDTYASTSEWWIALIHPEDRDRVMAGIQSAIDEGQPRWSDEYRFQKADGSFVIVEDRGFAIFDVEKKAVRMVGAMADVTESRLARRRLETTVADRTAELREAVKEAESFNYSISHDLRTPLRAISSTSDILLEEAGPELSGYHRELLERQSHNSRRLGLLIDQLLRLSRLGRVEMVRSRLNVSAIAQAVAAEISQADGDDGCVIEVQEDMAAEGDSALVRLVLSNLIENACKFSSGKGTVRVRQGGPVFSVSDEGVGFDMRYAKKLFLPFERLVKDSDFPGTGIGLANVERIIRRHNGRVWAESEPGKGATFFFTLGE